MALELEDVLKVGNYGIET